MRGYVYILSHPSMDGLIKIGSTARSPYKRAQELSKGLPRSFVVEFALLCENFLTLERSVHTRLKADRVDPHREFFRTQPGAAIDVIRSLSGILPAKNAQADAADHQLDQVGAAAPAGMGIEFDLRIFEEIMKTPRLFQGRSIRLQAILPKQMLHQLSEATRRALRLPVSFRDSYCVNAFVDFKRTGTFSQWSNESYHTNVLLADQLLSKIKSSSKLCEKLEWKRSWSDIVDASVVASYALRIDAEILGYVESYRGRGAKRPGLYVSAGTAVPAASMCTMVPPPPVDILGSGAQ